MEDVTLFYALSFAFCAAFAAVGMAIDWLVYRKESGL